MPGGGAVGGRCHMGTTCQVGQGTGAKVTNARCLVITSSHSLGNHPSRYFLLYGKSEKNCHSPTLAFFFFFNVISKLVTVYREEYLGLSMMTAPNILRLIRNTREIRKE